MTLDLASRISVAAMAAAAVLMSWLPTVSVPLSAIA
jgi:hypothetical protein